MPTPSVQPRLRDRLQAAATAFWGPGAPIGSPLSPIASEPRVRVYRPGANAMPTPRAEEEATPFGTLRMLARNYDVAAICINYLRARLMGLNWAIVPTAHAPQGTAQAKAATITRLTEQLQYPDGDQPLDQWLGMLLVEDLEIGAPVVYKRPTRAGGLAQLDVVQGDTIKPLIDARGVAVAYQQFYAGTVYGTWPKEQIVYAPRLRRRDSVYGVAPTELVFLTVNRALRRQGADLSYYTDGNIPAALAGAPENWTPGQIKEFQEYWDYQLSGDAVEQRKLHMWPGDPSKVHEFRPYEPSSAQEMWLLQVTCAAFEVRPEEIGFTTTVNRSTGEMQQDSQTHGVRALAKWAEGLLTPIIQRDCQEPLLQFQFQIEGEQQDAKDRATADALNIQSGIYSPGYVRQRDGIQLAADDPLLATPPPAPPAPTSAPAPPATAPAVPTPDDTSLARAQRGELRKWQDKALAQVRAGRSAACPFASTVLAPPLTAAIHQGLLGATSPDAVRAVFNLVRAVTVPTPLEGAFDA